MSRERKFKGMMPRERSRSEKAATMRHKKTTTTGAGKPSVISLGWGIERQINMQRTQDIEKD